MHWTILRRRMSAATAVVSLVYFLLAVAPLSAQTAISADGGIESTAVGFIFPDGSVQATAAAPNFAPVADTGQQSCWNGVGNLITCPGTGQDGELQRGVQWPTPRFTDNLDGTVTDNLTGLIWVKSANCLGFNNSWEGAMSTANAFASGQCGVTDGSVATEWRLPNIKELLSLVDYGESSAPFVPPGHPFVNVAADIYWSSTTEASDPDFARMVHFGAGSSSSLSKSNTYSLWPVRGGQ